MDEKEKTEILDSVTNWACSYPKKYPRDLSVSKNKEGVLQRVKLLETEPFYFREFKKEKGTWFEILIPWEHSNLKGEKMVGLSGAFLIKFETSQEEVVYPSDIKLSL